MAEPSPFRFDFNQRAAGTVRRPRPVWLAVIVSLGLHGLIVLLALTGAARGGYPEIMGSLEVTVTGPPSQGDGPGHAPPETADPTAADAPPEAIRRPPEAPQPPQPEVKPVPPAEAPRPPEIEPPKRVEALPKPAPTLAPDALPMPEVKPTPKPAPDVAAPKPAETTPTSPKPPMAAPTAPPDAPKKTVMAKPRQAPGPPGGFKQAPPGQTAARGSPDGGDRLGRNPNEADGPGGVIAINLNPRFRSPPSPPHYPRMSVAREEEGVVLVRAFVDPAGAPQQVVVFKSSGFPLLDGSALEAVRGWRFEPMVREGRTIAAWVQVPVRFRLQN